MEKVHDWYSREDSYGDMGMNAQLKIWEKQVISQLFWKNAVILDIGCGMGREAFALYDLEFTVIGADISETALNEAIRLAAKSGRNIRFIHTNGMDFPFDDNSFDIIIIWSQTFGLFYGDIMKAKILAECKRMLKDGGLLSFSAHDRLFIEKNYPKHITDRKFYPYDNDEIYWESFTEDELKSYVINAGFDVICCAQGEIYKPEDGVVLHCECRKI